MQIRNSGALRHIVLGILGILGWKSFSIFGNLSVKYPTFDITDEEELAINNGQLIDERTD